MIYIIVFIWLVTMMSVMLNPQQLIASITGEEGYLRHIVGDPMAVLQPIIWSRR